MQSVGADRNLTTRSEVGFSKRSVQMTRTVTMPFKWQHDIFLIPSPVEGHEDGAM
jgi:hypothetical protein